MSKTQKVNKEKKKPKADKDQPKSHVSAYKAAQGQGKPSFNPFARKTWAKPMTSMPFWNLAPWTTLGK